MHSRVPSGFRWNYPIYTKCGWRGNTGVRTGIGIQNSFRRPGNFLSASAILPFAAAVRRNKKSTPKLAPHRIQPRAHFMVESSPG
jgi:hypothetical protein